MSFESVAVQTKGILIVTNEAGAQAGGFTDVLHPTPTVFHQGIQTEDPPVISIEPESEPDVQASGFNDVQVQLPVLRDGLHPETDTNLKEVEVQVGGSSNVALHPPPAILHQGVQTDETPVVSIEAQEQAGGSSDTRQVQLSKGVQAEVVHIESAPETHRDVDISSSQSSPSVDTSHDEGPLTQKIPVASGERENGCDGAAPRSPSTSSEVSLHTYVRQRMLLLPYHLVAHC